MDEGERERLGGMRSAISVSTLALWVGMLLEGWCSAIWLALWRVNHRENHNRVGSQCRGGNRIFGGHVMFANGAENSQRADEQYAKDNELAALSFEKIEKGARFHG
jgi:hypothetical protein